MDTSRLEELLEQLVDKQDELISRLEILESTVQDRLSEVHTELVSANHSLSNVHDELNWWGEGASLAKQVLEALSDIKSAVDEAA
jgi:CHASE3 domain sensor protein